MKFLTRLAVLIYVTMASFMGVFIALFVLQYINFNVWVKFLYFIYSDKNLRIIVGSIGGVILIGNFVFYRFFSVNVHREKIIAFDNPAGRVSVSLMAIEDIIKRMLNRLPEVKDVKAFITAAKKGLKVKVKLILLSEVNIPEVTSKVQEMVFKKVQDIIGLEEQIDISIYIGKILPEKVREGRSDNRRSNDDTQGNIPFQGYRA